MAGELSSTSQERFTRGTFRLTPSMELVMSTILTAHVIKASSRTESGMGEVCLSGATVRCTMVNG